MDRETLREGALRGERWAVDFILEHHFIPSVIPEPWSCKFQEWLEQEFGAMISSVNRRVFHRNNSATLLINNYHTKWVAVGNDRVNEIIQHQLAYTDEGYLRRSGPTSGCDGFIDREWSGPWFETAKEALRHATSDPVCLPWILEHIDGLD